MSADINIYKPNGEIRMTAHIGSGSKRTFLLMKEDSVTLKFTIPTPTILHVGDYIEVPTVLHVGDHTIVENMRYELTDPYKAEQDKGSGGYRYEVKLHAQYWKFKNKLMKFLPMVGTGETSWNYTDTIDKHANQLLDNFKAQAYTTANDGTLAPIPGRSSYLYNGDTDWDIKWDASVDSTKAVTISYDSTNIIDAISDIAKAYECEWWFEAETLWFGKCDKANTAEDLRLGGNMVAISRKDSKETYATRIYAYGSDRNLPSTYRKSLIFTADHVSGQHFRDSLRQLKGEWLPASIRTIRPSDRQTADLNSEHMETISSGTSATEIRVHSVTATIGGVSAGFYDFKFSEFCPEVAIGVSKGSSPQARVEIDMKLNYADGQMSRQFFDVTITPNGQGAAYTPTFKDVERINIEHDIASISLTVNYYVSLDRDSTAFVGIIRGTNRKISVTNRYPVYGATNLTIAVLDSTTGEISRTIEGASFNTDYRTDNPDIELPSGESIAAGTKYTLPQINKALAPASYFTNKYTALDKYADLTTDGIVNHRLLLPEIDPETGLPLHGYLEVGNLESEEEAVEDVVTFEDCYPSRTSTITDIKTGFAEDPQKEQDGSTTYQRWTTYLVQDDLFNASNPFNKENYLIDGTDLQITFQSGLLNGLTFKVSYTDEHYFEIQRDDTTKLPNEIIKPQIGDQFSLSGFNIAMISDEATDYIGNAERRLLAKAKEYRDKLTQDASTYQCTLSCDWAKARLANPLGIGMRVNLIAPGYFENGRESRIIGYEIPLDIPWDNPVYTIGEKPSYSRIGAIEDKLDSIEIKAGSLGGVSVSEQQRSLPIIKRHDSTPPKDTNVFSALRTLSEIAYRSLSRIDNDTAAGVITFQKWVEFGRYLAGFSGAFLGMTEVGSLGEMDYLKVRKKAQFETLEIAEVRYVGGKLIVAPGDGLEIIAVEELPDGYKCYYKGSETDADGHSSRVRNKFALGDQIYCKVSNVTEGAFFNHYWWRLCTEVGDEYFVVSKTDCDGGSDTPMVGDKCAQLGNRTDMTRQSAIVLSTIEIGHSPLLSLYGDIETYSLDGKDHVSMGAGADGVPFMTVYGKMYVGTRSESTYIRFTPENGVEIKAHISAESSVGGQTFNQYINNTIMGQIADDGILTPIEKRQLLAMLIEIRQEYDDLTAKADAAHINIDGYDAAYWSLLFWLTGETKEPAYLLLEDGARLLLEDGGGIVLTFKGALSDMTETTPIDREQYLSLLRTYYSERDRLNIDKLYGDYTQTAIDGGLITTGAIELRGASEVTHAGITGNESGGDDDVRIWAGATKEQRATAPFRVTQKGNLTAHNADIQGDITARSLTLQGDKSFFYVTSANETNLELTDVPFMACRTIEIWMVKTADTNPKITFTAKNENVWIARNFNAMPTQADYQTNPNLLEELASVAIQDKGLFKCFGFNIGSRTIWNIVKYEDSYTRGRQ